MPTVSAINNNNNNINNASKKRIKKYSSIYEKSKIQKANYLSNSSNKSQTSLSSSVHRTDKIRIEDVINLAIKSNNNNNDMAIRHYDNNLNENNRKTNKKTSITFCIKSQPKTESKDSGLEPDLQESWKNSDKNHFFAELHSRGYIIKARIGEGSYSKVYYAENKYFYINPNKSKKILGTRPAACKIIDRRNTSNGFHEKFLPRELEILQTISHPNIVEIHAIFEMGPFISICMEYCGMGDLLERIRKFGSLSEKRSKLFFTQLLSAINYLHSKNISHRDIKCENILIYSKTCVKLTDFGFSKCLYNCNSNSNFKCNNRELFSRTFCGSTAYAAPEVLKGIPYDTKLYDMWSLGCVLFIMICGSMPYDDENIISTIRKQENHVIDFPEKKISYGAKNMISKLLHPDLSKRLRIEAAIKHPWVNE